MDSSSPISGHSSVPHVSTIEVAEQDNSNGYLLPNMDSLSPISGHSSYPKSNNIMSEVSYLTPQQAESSSAHESTYQSDSSEQLDLSSSNCDEHRSSDSSGTHFPPINEQVCILLLLSS